MGRKHALFIDYEFCSGCRSCEVACRNELGLPFEDYGMRVLEDGPRQNPDGAWHWDYIAYPTELCDLCAERTQEGQLPMCVQSCQAKVLSYGEVGDCARLLVEKGGHAGVFMP